MDTARKRLLKLHSADDATQKFTEQQLASQVTSVLRQKIFTNLEIVEIK